MRNLLKATTLENRFPLLAVEEGCILSKDADITVAFRVELPELYMVTSAEYAAIHSSWVKAIKVLPTYSVVHKQDWFVKEGYRPDLQKENMSFLSRSFERHFNERPFLNHACYLLFAISVRHQDGRPQWQAHSSRHLRPADEERHHHEPKQIHLGSFGQWQVVFHQPPLEAVLGAEHPYRLGGHGKQLSGLVRDDTPQDAGRGWGVLHLLG